MPTDRTNQVNDDDGPQIDENKVYLITGKSLKELLATLKRIRPLAGDNITLAESDSGVTVNGA